MTVKLRLKLLSWSIAKQQTITVDEQLKNKTPGHQKISGGFKHSYGRKNRRKKNH
jgi:hypothetical protein